MRSIFAPDDRRSLRSLAAVFLGVSLVAAACGGGSDDAGSTSDDTPSDGTTSAEAAATDTEAADGEAASGDAASSGVASASIPWSAPEGFDATEIEMSPDGSRFAIAFAGPIAPDAQPGEIVVFDVASASELWRVSIDDIGILGFNLVFTDAGVTNLASTFEGTTAITYDDGAVVSETPLADCGQFLNGTVAASGPVFFTVLPGGVCRVDVTSGAETVLALEDITPGSGLVNSIRFDADGTLLVAYQDQDFASATASVDPATLTIAEANTGRTEPLSAADRFGSQLDGDVFASSEARAAQSADGSIVGLLQSGQVDIVG